MSGRAVDPLRCVGCAKPFASEVPFCPFCGVRQRAEPQAVRPPPEPVVAAPDSAVAAAPVADTVAAPDSVPVPGIPEPPTVQPPTAPVRVRPPHRTRWRAWLFGVVLVAAVVASLLNLGGPVTAALVVQVHGPDGALVTAGQVLVNDHPAGAAGETLAVPPGTMAVSFVKHGWSVEPRTVTVAGHASLTVDLTARALPGHLELTTDPPGAAVAFAGRNRGRTPFSADLDPGNYDISVSLPGYVGKRVTLTVAPGDPATINLPLVPVPPRRVAAPFERGVMMAATPLLAAPSPDADTLALLDPVTEVQVEAKVLTDPPWLQVRAGTLVGYVPASGSVESWQSWADRNTVAGPVDAVTPDLRVVIAGYSYPLAGVQEPQSVSPSLATMESTLSASLRGVPVRCVPHDTASFICITTDGRDVAQLYLLNGGAVVRDGVTGLYADAQRDARQQRRGLWGP